MGQPLGKPLGADQRSRKNRIGHVSLHVYAAS
jgi:hypothetical protein